MYRIRLLVFNKFNKKSTIFIVNRLFSKEKEVICHKLNNCGLISINRPKVLNSLNQDVIEIIKKLLVKWRDDPQITHLLLKGSGDKAFSSGGDIVEIVNTAKNNLSQAVKNCCNEYSMDYMFVNYSKPIVTIIDGYALGGGCGISLYNKYVVSTERSKLAMPETAIGFFPDCGASYFLSRLPHNIGYMMGLSGQRLIGEQVFHLGLSTHHIDSSQVNKLIDDVVNTSDVQNLPQILSKFHKTPSDSFHI